MSDFTIGRATADDVSALPGIELRAATLFSPEDLAPEDAEETTPISVYEEAQRDGRVFVARDDAGRPIGFSHVEWIEEVPHLEELDVEPDWGRRGIGRKLVEAACDWALSQGAGRITLSTFRDVAWNAPFYARIGFRPIPEEDLSRALRALREKERLDGLDPSKRVMMCRSLSETERPASA